MLTAESEMAKCLLKCLHYILEMQTPLSFCTGLSFRNDCSVFQIICNIFGLCGNNTGLKSLIGGNFLTRSLCICTSFFSSCIEILNRWSLMLTMAIKGLWITSHSAFFSPLHYSLPVSKWTLKSYCHVFKLEQVNVNSLKRGKSSTENWSCLSTILWAEVNLIYFIIFFKSVLLL